MTAVLSTSRFSFHDGILVAEASDLRELAGRHQFDLVSAVTARRVRYSRVETIRDREQEVVAWRFAAVPGQDVPAPDVHILND